MSPLSDTSKYARAVIPSLAAGDGSNATEGSEIGGDVEEDCNDEDAGLIVVMIDWMDGSDHS